MLFKALADATAVCGAVAQRPVNTTICDYYTTALLKNNTAANQKTLLTLVVNTAVIGNCTLRIVHLQLTLADASQTLNQTSGSPSQVSSPKALSWAPMSTSYHTSTAVSSLQTGVVAQEFPSTSSMAVELLLL